MREYSPKRRTAVVLAGSGTSGAYHAGALKALDESGVKVDLLVGSGAGAVAAAFGAIAGGPKLYGAAGFWHEAGWSSFYRLRLALRTVLLLLGASFGVFLLPLLLAIGAGLLFPLVLIVDVAWPGLPSRILGGAWAAPAILRDPYLAALAAPIFALSVIAFVFVVRLVLKDRRRLGEAFEAVFDAQRGHDRLRDGLWSVARGAALQAAGNEKELGRRYVALASENLGQPGFRELIVRTADLETGGALSFVLLADAHRAAYAAARSRGPRSKLEGLPGAVDLRAAGYDELLFDAVATGLVPPLAAPVRRVAFPRGGIFPGETHRLTEGTLAPGCGISEALAAGAEQVIVVTAVPDSGMLPPRRRGALALADAVLSTLEKQGVDLEVATAERTNRMVETLGHRGDDGRRAWEDPATGHVFREFSLYVVRPERRPLGPLELDGARDPATEVMATTADLLDQGYRDAYRLFVEPVVGAAPEPKRPALVENEEGQAVEL